MKKEGYKETSIGVIPDDWEVLKIGDILKIGSGKDYKHLSEGNIPVYGTGGYMTAVSDYLYDGESVGIGRKGTIDKPVFLKGKFWTVDTLFYTHSFTEVLPYYVYLLFQTIDWKKYNEATGVPSLSKVIIESIKIPKPKLPEQQKIAKILSTVDAKLENITQQIQTTEQLKKGLMQQLLSGKYNVLENRPYTNEELKDSSLGKIPKEWEVVKSNEAFELIHGYQFREHDFVDEGCPIVKIGQINMKGKLDLTNCSFFSLNRSQEFTDKEIKNGDILMALTGATLGKSCLVEGLLYPVYQNYRVGRFEPKNKEGLDKKFLFYLISSPLILKQIFAKINSGAQGNIGKNDFEKLKILLPNIREQQKIVTILRTVDTKIEQLQTKKAHYTQLKKGLMQQLLTGKIRVKV
ncbi:restriction endonuclease subunit S [Tenacibaculum amylolyticum]|uniref:restriction endonuclease subunit S n=1 Tax=Tenacibaculum amylolyticum TaxID=104269 RepID=UPI0038954ED2